MAHPKLVNADQPLPVRCLLRIYEMCASLRMAVILIFTLAATLAFATFVEAAYGTPAVQFFVYQTWWFNALNAMLAVSIFCAATIRFPWQRHQTGFVITHIGLLTLLFGAMIGRIRGIDAQIPIYEDQIGRYAFDGSDLRFIIRVDSSTESSEETPPVVVPFPSSPFNWPDFSDHFAFQQPDDAKLLERVNPLARFGWKLLRWSTGNVFKLANRTQPDEKVYADNDIKLETIDFFSDSKEIPVPYLKFKMSLPAMTRIGPDGKPVKGPVRWTPVELKIDQRQVKAQYPVGLGDSQMLGGGRVVFTMSSSAAHTQALLEGGPDGTIGEQGQVVLFAGGKRQTLDVSKLLGQGPVALANTPYLAEVTESWHAWKHNEDALPGERPWSEDPTVTTPQSPVVLITIYLAATAAGGEAANRPLSTLLLFANNPEGNIHDHKNEIYGDLWFDFSGLKQQEASQIGAGDRLEFFQTHDYKLYYRYWKRAEKKLRFTRQVPLKGSPQTAINAFKMPIAQLKLYVEEFHAADKPDRKTLSLPFDRGKTLVQNRAVAKVRLTVDGQSKEEWVRIFVGTPDETERADQILEVRGKNRTVSVSMHSKAIDIGFRIRLKNFERKLDPGTSQASHFSSWVDFLNPQVQTYIRSYDVEKHRVSERKIPSSSLPADGISSVNRIATLGQLALSADGKYLVWTDPVNKRLQRLTLNNRKDIEPTTFSLEHAKTTVPASLPDNRSTDDVKLLQPIAVAVHPQTSTLYWVDQQRFHGSQVTVLYGAQSDGKNVQSLLQTTKASLDDLVIAPSLKKIYWADHRRGRIGRCNLDGSEQEMDFIGGLSRPGNLAIDPSAKLLYWSEVVGQQGEIRRARLDGAQQATVVQVKDNHHVVRGLAVAPQAKKLYWIQSEEHPGGYIGRHSQQVQVNSRLMSSSLIGRQIKELPSSDLNQPTSLVFNQDSHTLYWNQPASYRHDVYITMNAPVEFSNTKTGQTYRLFQESFSGPWKPGSVEYEQMVSPTSEKEELYLSVLTVNADPGRWIRNLGCLFIVFGIATMFYMRAYFFKPRPKKRLDPSNQSSQENASTDPQPNTAP